MSLIVVTNDDGISSKGIKLLVNVAKKFGDVLVVAPDSPQSGMGHAITIGDTLRLDKVDLFGDIEAYECSGTPADCVKFAKNYVLDGRSPDLVVSGLNHGSNTSISVLYSGTMSAAIEGALDDIPSIGFSLTDYDPNGHLDHAIPFIENIIKQGLNKGFMRGVALNVNIPKVSDEPIKGIRICRQARATWAEKFEEREDLFGRKYFWLGGEFENHDKGEDTDEWAIRHNYVSIVPCQYDMTGHHVIGELNDNWDLESN